MNALDKIRTNIEAGKLRVIMPLGGFDFTPGSNFFFAVIPWKRRGVQWNRDLMPALRRFIRMLPGFEKRSFQGTMRQNRYVDGSISSIEGYEPNEGVRFFDNRRAGKNERLWVVYDDGEFDTLAWE